MLCEPVHDHFELVHTRRSVDMSHVLCCAKPIISATYFDCLHVELFSFMRKASRTHRHSAMTCCWHSCACCGVRRRLVPCMLLTNLHCIHYHEVIHHHINNTLLHQASSHNMFNSAWGWYHSITVQTSTWSTCGCWLTGAKTCHTCHLPDANLTRSSSIGHPETHCFIG